MKVTDIASQQTIHDLDHLVGAADALVHVPLRDAGHRVVRLEDTTPYAEVESAAGDVVDGDGLFGEHRGGAVDHVAHEHRQPDAARHCGPSRYDAPAIQELDGWVERVAHVIAGHQQVEPCVLDDACLPNQVGPRRPWNDSDADAHVVSLVDGWVRSQIRMPRRVYMPMTRGEVSGRVPGRRVVVLVTVVLVVAAVGLPLWATAWTREHVESVVRERALEGQLAAATSIDQQSALAFDFTTDSVKTAATRPGLVDAVSRGDAARAGQILANVAELTPLTGLTVYDAAGVPIAHHSAPGAPLLERPAEPVVTGPVVRDRRAITTVIAPVIASSAIVGYLQGEFEFASLFPDDSVLRYGRRGTISLVDVDGFILASGSRASVGLPLLAPEAREQARRRIEHVSTYFAPRFGYQVISAYVPARDRNWGALVVAPEEQTFAPVARLGRQLEVGGLAFAAVSVAVAVAVSATYLARDRRLRDAQHELLRANDDLEAFASVAAHDLKSPLATIRGFGDLILAEPGISPEIEQHASVIVRRAESMATLVNELLAFAMTARRTTTREDVDVGALIDEVKTAIASLVEERDAVVRTPERPTVVAGDRTQLTQLFQNLIANAILHCPADRRPEVTVSVAEGDGVTEIAVEDNGAGVPEADRERVLRAFERGAAGDTARGTGLGLAIVARIIEGHGGELIIRDSPLGGAAFVVRLPR